MCLLCIPNPSINQSTISIPSPFPIRPPRLHKQSVTPSKNTKRSNAENEQIAAAESQHQYEDRHISGHHPRAQQPHHQTQQLISQSEYLAFVRENERAAAAAQHESSSPHPYGKHPTAQERAPTQFYSRNPGHPLAGSSLEKEIEKLVNSNVQQYAPSQQYINEQHISSSPQHEATVGAPVQHQFSGPTPQQQLRSPVVFKNHNDIVYIPYQQQLQRDQYAPRPGPGITKAKVQLISPYHSARTPFPSEAIEYGPGPQAPPPPYGPPKPQESFKDLFIQQQRENHLKRLHSQQQHQQQLAADNLNLQSHSQPLSISLLPKKQATPPPPPPPPSHSTAEQPSGNSNFAQFAERLFKTPLDQQKPLSPEMFKALVAAGYPVQAVPVPIAVTRVPVGHPTSPHQQPQRYAPATAVLASHPQPFTHPAKQQSQAPPIQYHQASPQTHRHFASSSPAHQQQPQAIHQQPPRPEAVHRFYAQGPYGPPQPQPQANNPNTHTTYQLPGGGVGPEPYTYVLQQGENEETAAEQLRQQIIHEINAQSQNKGSRGASAAAGFGRVEYQQSAAPQTAAGQGQTLATLTAQSHSAADSKPLTDEQKEYYKRLEYYSHNQ